MEQARINAGLMNDIGAGFSGAAGAMYSGIRSMFGYADAPN